MMPATRMSASSLLLVSVLLVAACKRDAPEPARPEPPVASAPASHAPVAPPVTPAAPPKPVAYKVEGGADAWYGIGVVCDFTQPFELKGGGLTMRFNPASRDGGSYKYDGTLGGFKVYGGEAYSVEWIGTEPVKIKGWGVGTVVTPIGPQSDNGIEHYTVERSFDACPPG